MTFLTTIDITIRLTLLSFVSNTDASFNYALRHVNSCGKFCEKCCVDLIVDRLLHKKIGVEHP